MLLIQSTTNDWTILFSFFLSFFFTRNLCQHTGLCQVSRAPGAGVLHDRKLLVNNFADFPDVVRVKKKSRFRPVDGGVWQHLLLDLYDKSTLLVNLSVSSCDFQDASESRICQNKFYHGHQYLTASLLLQVLNK